MTPADFIARWQRASGSELANAQLFVTELCELLDLPRPEPSSEDSRENAYVFERRVQFVYGDGSSSEGRIDCYRRGAFVLESKKIRVGELTKGFDEALLRARGQAEDYARALLAAEGRPPFLVVVDVGRVIELYSEFTRSGATYVPFPDPRSHRIRLADLDKEELRERLRKVWLEPDALDPSKIAARVTREVADDLAELSKSLEAAAVAGGVADAVARAGRGAGVERGVDVEGKIAAYFTGRGPWKARLPALLESLVAIGQARVTPAGFVAVRR